MKTMATPMLLMMATLSIASKAQSKQDPLLEEAKKAIAASNAIYFQSFIKNDPSVFINSYAEDACVLPPNAPMICGREALTKFIKDGLAMGFGNGKFITTNVYGDGKEYVTEEGVGKMYDRNGKETDDFKYLVLWKKTKDGWKMYRDSFSSNLALK